MDNIKNVSSNTTSTGLRGGMKVINDPAPVDTYSPSGKSEKSFLGKIGDTIKSIFSHDDEAEAKPQKEPGGWAEGPDGQSVWYTQSNPPAPKNAYGHWSLDTACGAANWYWCKNSEPADGPSYGPAYKPHGT